MEHRSRFKPDPFALAATGPERDGGGGLDAGLAHQRRWWLAQRCAWTVMALLLVAALFGVFGRGVLAHRSITSQDGSFTVEYDRFVRLHAPTVLSFRMPSERPLRVHLDHAYLEGMEVVSIMPSPESQRSTPQGVDFTFASSGGAGGRAVFRFKVQRVGSLAGTATLGSDDARVIAAVPIRQFAYP